MKKLLILLVVLTGCSIELRQEKPAEVNVNHKIDLTEVEKYFISYCEAENPDFTEIELDQCVDKLMVGFVEALGNNL